jgi:purine-nucleoside phosphorylase
MTLLKTLASQPVEVGIVLGSGLGPLADRVEQAVSIPYSDLPGFPQGGVSGHQSRLVIGTLGGQARGRLFRPRTLL